MIIDYHNEVVVVYEQHTDTRGCVEYRHIITGTSYLHCRLSVYNKPSTTMIRLLRGESDSVYTNQQPSLSQPFSSHLLRFQNGRQLSFARKQA